MEKARGRRRCPKMRDKRHEAAKLARDARRGLGWPVRLGPWKSFSKYGGFSAEDHEKVEAIC